MKEILRNEIAIRILQQGRINMMIRNLSVTGEVDEIRLNELLKVKEELERDRTEKILIRNV